MKKLFAGCVVVSFAAMLAACGDDSSSTSPDASGNESSSSEEEVSSSGKAPSSSEAASGSSSSVASSESRALVSGGVWPQFLWDGSIDWEGVVVTGSDEKTAGIWYDFNDRNDGGSSKFTFPPEYTDCNYYGSCIPMGLEAYGGLKVKVELGDGADNPYVGLGFNTLNEDQDGADVMEWGGLCLEYSSDLDFNVWLQAEDGTLTTDCQLVYRLGASDSVKTVDIPWSKFGSSCGFGVPMDATEVLANAAAVHLLFEGKAGDSGDFLLTKIGSLGQCNSGSVPVSSSAVAPKSSSSNVEESSSSAKVVNSNFLWDASTDKVGQVVTGGDKKTSGYWYDFYDTDDGGSSRIGYPPEFGDCHYYGGCITMDMDTYGGIKGKVTLGSGADNPHVGLGFNILSEDQDGVDVTEWGGLCLEYSSDLDFNVWLQAEDGTLTIDCQLAYHLSASDSVKMVDIPWSKFGSSCGFGMDIDASKVLANAAAVHLRFNGKAGDTGYFLLKKIGSLGQCNSGSVPAP